MAKDSLYRDRNLQIILGVTLMAVLGVSSITPAFPLMLRELGISGGQVGLSSALEGERKGNCVDNTLACMIFYTLLTKSVFNRLKL